MRSTLLLAFTACVASTEGTQTVEANDLGIVRLESTRTHLDGVEVYELRGLDAADHPVASLKLRVGVLPELALPGDSDVGSELTITAGAATHHSSSRETATFVVPALNGPLQAFVDLPEVAATLQRDANVVALHPARSTEIAYSASTMQCPADQLMATPQALGCCMSWNDNGNGQIVSDIAFVRGRDSNAVLRLKNYHAPGAPGCRAADGVSSCSAERCYYGPYGYSKATFVSPAGGYPYVYGMIYNGTARCSYDPYANGPWRVNFQTASTTTPAGYWGDSGLVYGDRNSSHPSGVPYQDSYAHPYYGWNVDSQSSARERNDASSPDKRYDTFNHMQLFGARTWEWATTNLPVPGSSGSSTGRYFNVHLVAGDPWNYDSTYKINVENVLALSGTPTASNRWVEGWNGWVDVSDGRLTISNASGSVNNKIDYVDILSLRAQYGDVSGTRANGGSCCTDGSGPCDIPGSPACTSCGGQNLGTGQWDYQ